MSLEQTDVMDFSDQILFPLIYNIQGKKYDIIYVDEAQDLNPMQHDFIRHFLTPNGRVIAFGDPRQAIYGFRGADAKSMNKLSRMFNATSLPLSISYRCAQNIIKEAQSIEPNIEPRPSAPPGIVEDIDKIDIPNMRSDDLVICRNNAPLIRLGMKFLAARKPVHVRGDFGANIIKFVKKFKTDDISIFKQRLEEWYEVEYDKAEKSSKPALMNSIEEKYNSIKIVVEEEEPEDVKSLIRTFQRLFDAKIGTTLSSIHKAKGEEADRVFIYLPQLMPSKYARSQEQIEQEQNLEYVAITRAKNELYYVTRGN